MSVLTSSSSLSTSLCRRIDNNDGNDETGGYDVEVIELGEIEKSRYRCPICLLWLRDPLQTSCGHRFCKLCIRRWCCETPECPTCKRHIAVKSDLFPDNCAKREILNLSCRCVNRKHGCDVISSLGQLETHLEVCTAAKQLCELCGEKVSKLEFNHHRTQICSAATVQCQFHAFGCNQTCERRNIGQHMSDSVEQHLMLLASYVVSRPCGCDNAQQTTPTNAQRLQQLAHVIEPIKLPANERGQLHNDVNVTSLPARTDAGLPPSYFTEERLAEICRALQDQRQPRAVGKQTSSSVMPQVATVQTAEDAVKLSTGQTADTIRTSRAPDTLSMLREQAMKIAQYEARVVNLEAKISELESDSGCRQGVYVMKIDSFTSRRLHEAATGQTPVVYSQAFYTHPQGYKFCLRVHPYGVNQSGQSPDSNNSPFMSLFIHLMRGDYDDILEWPFRGRITLTVLDVRGSSSSSAPAAIGRSSSKSQQQQQSARKKDISSCVTETDPTLEAFQRPTSSRSRRGFGYVEFVSLADLLTGTGTGSDPTASPYLIDDTLYIRTTVEPAKNIG